MERFTDQTAIVSMLRRATDEVLATMLNITAVAGQEETEEQPRGQLEGLVSFVGLAGERWAGTGSLQCSSRAACRFASSLLMSEFHAVDAEVLDAFGELTNMIIGSFKNDLEQCTGPMGLSIPTVIHGHNFSTRSLSHERWTVIPFECGGEQLLVKACLKQRDTPLPAGRGAEKHSFILA